MPVLQLSVRWLAPEGIAAYHGEEWPPAPARLFRALLAGARRPGGAGERGVAALRRLEVLPPPEIVAPVAERCDPVRAAVPNNDGDCILQHHQAGRTIRARHAASSLRTLRRRQGWRVPAPIHYRWRFPAADPDPEAFRALAADLTLLGQGTDLAAATAVWSEHMLPRQGLIWVPDPDGERALRVAAAGEVERLTRAYRDSRDRIGPGRVRSIREPVAHRDRYRDPLALPRRRWQAFLLARPDDHRPWSVPATEGLRVAAMVRHAVQRAAVTAGLEQAAITELMGHGGDGRILVLPLPNVGHRWADGRVRRVMVSAGPAVPDEHWQAVLLRLVQAELIAEGAAEPSAVLLPVSPAEDKLLWRYSDPAKRWCCATPVILPGFDHRRGRPRPERTARRLLRHAGIPAAAVRAVHLAPAPALSGVADRRAIRVPRHLQGYPRAFVTLAFHQPVAGPLALGAGAGYGLGLLTHDERSGDEAGPGERSRSS